nr:MAG TPA: ATPase [Caudoviricetes sp.]
MLWKLGIFFITIGLVKIAYYLIQKWRDKRANR